MNMNGVQNKPFQEENHPLLKKENNPLEMSSSNVPHLLTQRETCCTRREVKHMFNFSYVNNNNNITAKFLQMGYA